MRLTQKQIAATLLAGVLTTYADVPLQDQSLTRLEQRIEAIDSELEQLARYSLRSGVGAIGYRSSTEYSDPAHTEWIRIELGQETPIDQIVLVPAIWRDTKTGFRADGFPVQFKIVAGTDQDPKETVIASFDEEHHLLPRIAPVIIPCATTASWVRVDASRLSPRAFDGQYNFELAEIMIFNGQENVALNQPVSCSSIDALKGNARRNQFVVDGFVPYLLDAGHETQSIPFLSFSPIGDLPSITIDLETAYPLNRIHLHSIDLTDTMPQSTPADFGLPNRLLVEGANRADFSDAVRLIEYRKESIYDVGPILMRRFPETLCRYVRLTALEPYIFDEDWIPRSRLGFAEIELFSNGRNIAYLKPARGARLNSDRSLSSLTDGLNLYGRILPVRQWMGELARRHDLEIERPLINTELSHRYARHKTTLRRMTWLAALLAAGIGFTFLIEQMLRMIQIKKIRERFAADLHDELGANLHTIGLLSNLAEDSAQNPEELSNFLQQIRFVTKRSGIAVRHVIDMQESDELFTNLLKDMTRAAERIVPRLEHNITVEGEEHLDRLKPRTRNDFFLFYKECLINICRHSGATRISTHLTASPKKIRLAVSDNGLGLSGSAGNGIPPSLKRRAHLLAAEVTAEQTPSGGAKITLTLRPRRGLHCRPLSRNQKSNLERPEATDY